VISVSGSYNMIPKLRESLDNGKHMFLPLHTWEDIYTAVHDINKHLGLHLNCEKGSKTKLASWTVSFRVYLTVADQEAYCVETN
jgi:hypothetical protein